MFPFHFQLSKIIIAIAKCAVKISFSYQKNKGDNSSLLCIKLSFLIRACSHEPGTVNYPGAMIAPGQALPRVHMMICCPGAMLPRVNFIAQGQVHRNLITTNLSEFL